MAISCDSFDLAKRILPPIFATSLRFRYGRSWNCSHFARSKCVGFGGKFLSELRQQLIPLPLFHSRRKLTSANVRRMSRRRNRTICQSNTCSTRRVCLLHELKGIEVILVKYGENCRALKSINVLRCSQSHLNQKPRIIQWNDENGNSYEITMRVFNLGFQCEMSNWDRNLRFQIKIWKRIFIWNRKLRSQFEILIWKLNARS